MASEGTDDLERWAAEARARAAAESRVKERWLRQQAAEEATLSGLLLDLAESGSPVVATTDNSRRHLGLVTLVGSDFVAVRTGAGRLVLLPLHRLATVEAVTSDAGPRSAAAAAPVERGGLGDLDVRLVDVLAEAAADRTHVEIRVGDVRVVGDLVAVGADIVTVRTDGMGSATATARLAGLSEVYLFDSG